jgi:two-component system LytT family sensor kinase
MVGKFRWIHILWWTGLYLAWLLVFQNHAFTFSRTLTVQFCYLVFIVANFYWNLYYIIPVFLYHRRYFSFAAGVLTGVTIAALLRVVLASYLNAHFFLVNKPQPGIWDLFASSFLNIFIWVVCILSGKLLADRFRFQQYVADMEQQKTKAELDFLNAQFNPHFLFNSINSIYGHIDKHNIPARNMLLSFSEMLRYQLYECNTQMIDIDKELGYIKNYVAMQQVRKEESLVVKMDVNPNASGFMVAPLLFIAFIENAFKFVSSCEDMKNLIAISFSRQKDTLVFHCLNTKEPGMKQRIDHGGIGINNAKRRLALIYPGKHALQVTDHETTYEVNLQLELR